MKKALVVISSLLLLAGAGCAGTSSTSTTVETTQPPAAGGSADGSAQGQAPGNTTDSESTQITGSWKFVSLKQPGVEQPKDAAGLGATLTFNADGKFSGKVCNNMGGSYRIVEGNRLVSADVFATKMFCEGVLGEIEAAFIADLAIGMGVARNGDTLLLLGATGDVFTLAHE